MVFDKNINGNHGKMLVMEEQTKEQHQAYKLRYLTNYETFFSIILKKMIS